MFLGKSGSGKTICIRALSHRAPTRRGRLFSLVDACTMSKAISAVDYGEIELGVNNRLLFYGLSAHPFSTIFPEAIREGLVGFLVLVDASAGDAIDGLRKMIAAYRAVLGNHPFVVALNKTPTTAQWFKRERRDVLSEFELKAPICAIDARRHDNVIHIADLLLLIVELREIRLNRCGVL